MSISLPSDFHWKLVMDEDDIEQVYEKLKNYKYLVYDIENSDQRTKEDLKVFDKDKPARPHQGRLMMLGVGFDDGSIFVLPWEHKQGPDTPGWRNKVAVLAMELLENDKPKAAQNGKYDNNWLQSRLVFPKQTYDTMLALYLLDENQPKGQKYQSEKRYGAPDYAANVRYDEDFPLKELALYCALDIYYLLKLYVDTKHELAQEQGLARVFKHIVMPGSRVLERVEQNGMWVREDKLAETDKNLGEEIAKLKIELEDLSPIKGVNWNSAPQKAKVFYSEEGLDLNPLKYSEKTGNPSTDKEVLARLAQEYPLIAKLQAYNKARDLKKFTKAWQGFVANSKEHFGVPRIFPIISISRTVTGRLAAEEPNVMQVPRSGPVRQVFGAPPGKVFLEADGSQMELRIGAHEAQEPTMIRLLTTGRDLHKNTAMIITGKAEGDITKDDRQKAKASNFGLLFGQQVPGFQRYAFTNYGINWSREETTEVRDKWFEEYNGIRPWHIRCARQILKFGYIRSATGRIRHLPDAFSDENWRRAAAVREGTNFVVQSFANDIILLAMIELDRLAPRLGFYSIHNYVHDALLLEVDEGRADDVARLVKYTIEEHVPKVILPTKFGVHLTVPIESEVKIGPAWGDGTVWEA